jgi:hypothetical protein
MAVVMNKAYVYVLAPGRRLYIMERTIPSNDASSNETP